MSKAKSQFAAKKRPPTQRSSAPEIWCVDVYEHEAGWGQRLEDHLEFPSEEAAAQYVCEANARFAQHGSDECFALAHPPYRKSLDHS